MYWLIEDSEAAKRERRLLRRQGVRFDLVGFLLVATFLGSLEVVLDEGQRKDWFGTSTLMNVFGVLTVVSFVAMIPWLLRKTNPVIDIRLLDSRQFGSCFIVMLFTGAVLIATTQFIPQITQEYYGYTATLSGLVLGPGGIMTVVSMLVIGQLSGFVQPKWLIATGAAIVAAGMYDLTRINGETTFSFFAWSRIYIGIGLPMIFLSVTTASYEGLRKDQTDQASALINVARNVGGSMGVSLAQNVLAYRSQFHQSRLVESVNPANPAYQDTLAQATRYFQQHGYAGPDAQGQATAWIGQQLATQVAYWAYIDVFWVLGVLTACLIPLAMILKRVKLGGAAPAAH
jgi:DHA2 family multidrug resistance protein